MLLQTTLPTSPDRSDAVDENNNSKVSKSLKSTKQCDDFVRSKSIVLKTNPDVKLRIRQMSVTSFEPLPLSSSRSPLTSQFSLDFYSKAKNYWSEVSPTVDGMLCGFTSLNVPDIADSRLFLDKYKPKTTAYALDCGAGIGRITKQLLLPQFSIVDMVELTQAFLDKTREYVGEEDFARIGERFCIGLQVCL